MIIPLGCEVPSSPGEYQANGSAIPPYQQPVPGAADTPVPESQVKPAEADMQNTANRTNLTPTETGYKLYGLNYSPFTGKKPPGNFETLKPGQISSRPDIVLPYTYWIKTFGSLQGLSGVTEQAHIEGLKVAQGAWLNDDMTTNEQEIAALIQSARAGNVDMAVVGGEVLLRDELSEESLAGYIRQVRDEISAVPVTSSIVYQELIKHPGIADYIDVILVNYYPFWEGVEVNSAVALLHRWHREVVETFPDKEIIIGETGWPSSGKPIGEAVPSPENASFYFLNFVSWARANDVPYFYFEAFDETWKARYEDSPDASWGLWDTRGNLKPGMSRVFSGETIPDNWTPD